MRKRIHDPAHRGPLYPGADLRHALTDKEQAIITVPKGPEGIHRILFFFFRGEPLAEINADEDNACKKTAQGKDIIGSHLPPEKRISRYQVDKRPDYIER